MPLGDDNEAGRGPDLMLTTGCSDFGRVVTSTLIEGISNAAAKCVMVSKILASTNINCIFFTVYILYILIQNLLSTI